MPLYEVAIIQKATKKERDAGEPAEKLTFGPEAVVARDPQTAAIAAVTGGGGQFDPERSEVLVRPFAST